MARKKTQSKINTFLVAADALARTNQLVEAEIRYRDALRSAEKDHGMNSDQAMLVASILSAFYRGQGRVQEALEIEDRLASWNLTPANDDDVDDGRKFVGGGAKRCDQSEIGGNGVRVPANLRRACQILGIDMEVGLSVAEINRAWKKQMLSKSAHPDLGGNTDEAVLLNQAKVELMAFLEERAPKLGASLKKK